jgi:sugar-specific transcriptional regulator TrmB
MKLKESLQKLGFSAFDADLYLALLRKGDSPVGKLVSEIGSHRELVYGGLRRLENKGLVQSVERKKIRHYTALEPQILVRQAEDQAELAKIVLPELSKVFNQPSVSVKIYEGSEGFEEIQKDIQDSLRDNDEYFVIGGSGGDWYEVTGDFYMKYRRKSLKRGITLKSVTYQGESEGIVEKEPQGFCTVRVLPKNFSVPSATKVYADKVVIQVFGEQPVAIMIRSEAVSKSYKNYFELLWSLAKPL